MISFNLFCSVIHFILGYGIFGLSLITSRIDILGLLLIILVVIKICFITFGRCLLTLGEDNPYFLNVPTVLAKILGCPSMLDQQIEQILINTGIIIVANKIILISILQYYSGYK